uniref:Uncharacterized protein n=1 Tax=Megaviridae environmental sample TaxID=1737588 RepID=A0A5J6VJV3_9VIRU|nr:MAG: hypothetical protein [Megaviridae environmental sample]
MTDIFNNIDKISIYEHGVCNYDHLGVVSFNEWYHNVIHNKSLKIHFYRKVSINTELPEWLNTDQKNFLKKFNEDILLVVVRDDQYTREYIGNNFNFYNDYYLFSEISDMNKDNYDTYNNNVEHMVGELIHLTDKIVPVNPVIHMPWTMSNL